MNSSNNVLKFPKNRTKNGLFPQTPDEVIERIDDLKQYHIQESLEVIVPLLFNQIQILGFEPPEDENIYVKDGSFIVESIRAFLCKIYGVPHPLQMISDNIFEDRGDEGMVMSDRVKVVITTKEEVKE